MILMQQMLAKMGQGKKDISDIDIGYLPIGWTYEPSACESEFELIVADVLIDLIQSEYPQRLVLYNQVHTCGFRLDLVVYDRKTKMQLALRSMANIITLLMVRLMQMVTLNALTL